jgi:hypothetical protein
MKGKPHEFTNSGAGTVYPSSANEFTNSGAGTVYPS